MHFFVSHALGKACTMNCSAASRSREDLMRDCDECEPVETQSEIDERSRIRGVATALLALALEDGQVIVTKKNMTDICSILVQY